MPLKTGSTLTFLDFSMEDAGVRLHFQCVDPGPEQSNDYYIMITVSEMAAVTTQIQLRTLVQDRLNLQIRAQGVASKLTPFIGQTLVV